MFSTIFKCNKNPKESLAPTRYTNPNKNSRLPVANVIFCKNYMVFDKNFKFVVTGKICYIKVEMNSESNNSCYLITCMKWWLCCKFKSRFRIHKSDIKAKKDRRETATQFKNKYCHTSNPFVYFRVQLIEKVHCIYSWSCV